MGTSLFDFQVFLETTLKKPGFKDVSDMGVQIFLKQVFETCVADNLTRFSLEELGACAESLWKHGDLRKENMSLGFETLVINGPQEERLELLNIIQRDRHFIISSLVGEITAQGLESFALFHPIIETYRNEKGERVADGKPVAESMVQFVFPPLSDDKREALLEGIKAVLRDVHWAVDDFLSMRQTMDQAIGDLEREKRSSLLDEIQESLRFLEWLRDDHFAFLGCRIYDFRVGKGQLHYGEPLIVEGSGRGILRDPGRQVLRQGSEPALITPEIEKSLREGGPLIIGKSNIVSRVHRRVPMDYIGVKKYDEEGTVIGEIRFVGLFTAEAYEQSIKNVPLLRRKAEKILRRAGQLPGAHNEKTLRNILETYPRDEFFQIDEENLLRIGLGILYLYDRPRTKIFVRRDPYNRFVSVLVYVLREHYNSKVRRSIGKLLCQAYKGRLSAFYPQYGDSPLARIHFIIGLDPFDHQTPDTDELEEKVIELTQSWSEALKVFAEENADPVLDEIVPYYLEGFTAGYREVFSAEEALDDLKTVQTLKAAPHISIRAYQKRGDKESVLRFKLYRLDHKIALSDVMPIFGNMGIYVLRETGYHLRRQPLEDEGEGKSVWIHDFEVVLPAPLPFVKIKHVFEEAFSAVSEGINEDDGLNRLVLILGVSWREVAFLRTCAKYRQQTGMDPNQALQEQTLIDNPVLTKLLLELKTVRFDPDLSLDFKAREEQSNLLSEKIDTELNTVMNLEADRILRRLTRLIQSVIRTNFYQKNEEGAFKPFIAIKIASRDLVALPSPRPYREIFVSSPHVDGVHIRFGPVARGGIRWSDRRNDFRTEVLGLVKAQQVKNAVIVPVGSKGGFFPKQLPKTGDRTAIREEAIRAYKTFISGLLSLTDSLKGEEVTHPSRVIRWDGDDPYLVVAADKGTATFSDIANGLAHDAGFWLDDAFASGGSTGYDHKGMGITARGAWEAVKRHFREVGKDIQTEDFTVIGVGDMSGDVFGNGMLLSKKIKLLAAFDHRDIFFDPEPDPEISWKERQRLFTMPRSSWQDYDKALLSEGGGVYSRSDKAIKLHQKLQDLTGLQKDEVTPNELISALLKAPCELLWFGGIGTYLKAEEEQNWQVGDKANDLLRINSTDAKAQVIGEGANLGVTQLGRIAFARKGGKMNTDAVDNAAGVDTSDHEVNLKILLNGAVRNGAIDLKDRNKILESMTDDVAELVLDHNITQTRAISMAEASIAEDMDSYARLMDRLEREGHLDRDLEKLPSSEQLHNMKTEGGVLTRPELAVLIAYAKLTLFDEILASKALEDPYFEATLISYFPKAVHGFKKERDTHRLKQEIIATRLANNLVDLGGASFIDRLRELLGSSVGDIIRAFSVTEAVLDLNTLMEEIEALNNQIPAEVQTQMSVEVMRVLRQQTGWFAKRFQAGTTSKGITSLVDTYGGALRTLVPVLMDSMSLFDRKRIERRMRDYVKLGVPEDLASKIALLRACAVSCYVIELAREKAWPVQTTARLFFVFGKHFRLDRLREACLAMSSPQHWDRVALRRMWERFYEEQTRLVGAVMSFVDTQGGDLTEGKEQGDIAWASSVLEAWIETHKQKTEMVVEGIDKLKKAQTWSASTLFLALARFRELSASVMS